MDSATVLAEEARAQSVAGPKVCFVRNDGRVFEVGYLSQVDNPVVNPKFLLRLAKIKCLQTNDLDQVDQVNLQLFVDGKPYKSEKNIHKTWYKGAPSRNMENGSEWDLGLEIGFNDSIEVVLKELGGIPFTLGKIRIDHRIMHDPGSTVIRFGSQQEDSPYHKYDLHVDVPAP